MGFEPTVGFHLRRISSAVLSTTQPPLQGDHGDRGGPLERGAEPSDAGRWAQARLSRIRNAHVRAVRYAG